MQQPVRKVFVSPVEAIGFALRLPAEQVRLTDRVPTSELFKIGKKLVGSNPSPSAPSQSEQDPQPGVVGAGPTEAPPPTIMSGKPVAKRRC